MVLTVNKACCTDFRSHWFILLEACSFQALGSISYQRFSALTFPHTSHLFLPYIARLSDQLCLELLCGLDLALLAEICNPPADAPVQWQQQKYFSACKNEQICFLFSVQIKVMQLSQFFQKTIEKLFILCDGCDCLCLKSRSDLVSLPDEDYEYKQDHSILFLIPITVFEIC